MNWTFKEPPSEAGAYYIAHVGVMGTVVSIAYYNGEDFIETNNFRKINHVYAWMPYVKPDAPTFNGEFITR